MNRVKLAFNINTKAGLNMNWYLKVLKNYTGFEGRARRKEYWMFFLINIIISIVLVIIDSKTGLINQEVGYGLFSGIYTLGVLLPSIAVSMRRLHDTGRSGWWLLISFIPLIGIIVLFVFMVLDSQVEDNQYGSNPKSEAGI